MNPMRIRDSIENRLQETFQPERLEVIDESAHHAGHQPGMSGNAETHMRIRIVASAFTGQSRVNRHRAINDLLKPQFDAGLHALAIEAAAPGEAVRW